jgi:archaellum component FlaG (FlaF/FlaG flagellin family)
MRYSNHNLITTLSKILGATTLSALLSSCAMMQASEAQDTEQLLAAAGFKMVIANTPEKMAHLKTLTQYKIVPYQKDGGNHYIYADAANCQCFYWGQDDDYQAFMILQEQKNIADEDRMSAEMNQNQYLEWDTMGYGMGGYGMGFY